MTSSFVFAATRTPFARFGGALAGVRPDNLAASALVGLLAKTSAFDPDLLGDVFWGSANGTGEDNRTVGRMAVLLADLPTSIPATTINRLCGSSVDAAIMASRAVAAGDAHIVVAGGSESMTRAPSVLPKSAGGFPAGDTAAVSTTLGWRLVNNRMPVAWTASLGECNEVLQEKFGITRERQDAFTVRSHERAAAAWESGLYDDLATPVQDVDLRRDESIRPGTTLQGFDALESAFPPGGTITAGNASSLNDGASALLIGSEAAVPQIGSIRSLESRAAP